MCRLALLFLAFFMFLEQILGYFQAFKLQKSCPETSTLYYSQTTIVMLFPTGPPCRSGLELPLPQTEPFFPTGAHMHIQQCIKTKT